MASKKGRGAGMTATNKNTAEAMYSMVAAWKQEAAELHKWANLSRTEGRRWHSMEASAELCERYAAELERALKEGEANSERVP